MNTVIQYTMFPFDCKDAKRGLRGENEIYGRFTVRGMRLRLCRVQREEFFSAFTERSLPFGHEAEQGPHKKSLSWGLGRAAAASLGFVSPVLSAADAAHRNIG